MPFTEREAGEIFARVDQLEKTVASLGETLTEVRDAVVRTEGAWKTLGALAAISAAVGAVISQVVSWVIAVKFH